MTPRILSPLAFLVAGALLPGEALPQQDIDCEKDLMEAAKYVDTYWSFLMMKPGAIDLKKETAMLLPDAMAAASPDECADVLQRFMARLEDGHSSLQYYPGLKKRTKPEIELRSFRSRMVPRPGARPRVRVFVVSRDTTDPALADVLPGSEVLEIDGMPIDSLYWRMHERTAGSTPWWRDHVIDKRLLVGPEETEVTLRLRSPKREIYELTLSRPEDEHDDDAEAEREASLASQDTATVAESRVLNGGWGYLKLHTFHWGEPRETVAKFDTALAQVFDRPGLILDLRDNHGGYVSALHDIAGRFVDRRTILGYQQIRRPGSRYAAYQWDDPKRGISAMPPMHAKPRKPIYDGAVVILIDAGCFSACETFTGGLQSIGRAKVVGTGPSGGGSGWVSGSKLPSGAVISFSQFVSWRPDGTQIEHNGVYPDLRVSETPAHWVEGRDVVLEKAVELLTTGRAPTIADVSAPEER